MNIDRFVTNSNSFFSLPLPLSHIHINKFTQIFDAYVHNRFRKYLAFTRWKDKLEPTVLFQIFERSRAFPAISIRLNFCATFPWRVFNPGKIFVATRAALCLAPGKDGKKGICAPVTRENFLIEFRYLAKFFEISPFLL